MSNTKNFVASFTGTTNAFSHDVWAIWTDVNGWNKWDDGIENSQINEIFTSGSYFSLTPRGGEPIQIQLKTVTAGEEFSDEAVLPFGIIRNLHKMENIGGFLKITHEVQAEINEDAVSFFAKEIWPHMQNGLPESVKNIISIVECKD